MENGADGGKGTVRLAAQGFRHGSPRREKVTYGASFAVDCRHVCGISFLEAVIDMSLDRVDRRVLCTAVALRERYTRSGWGLGLARSAAATNVSVSSGILRSKSGGKLCLPVHGGLQNW